MDGMKRKCGNDRLSGLIGKSISVLCYILLLSICSVCLWADVNCNQYIDGDENYHILFKPSSQKHEDDNSNPGDVWIYHNTCGWWHRITKENENGSGNSLFKSGADTYIICHGWNNSLLNTSIIDDNPKKSDDNDDWVIQMAEAINGQFPNVNILAVDWGDDAYTLLPMESAAKIPEVADKATGFLESLITPSRTTIIGHSHGGHLGAIIGTEIYNRKNAKMKRFVGLETSSLAAHWINQHYSPDDATGEGKWNGDTAATVTEFYKSAWVTSMGSNDPEQLYGDYNFYVFGTINGYQTKLSADPISPNKITNRHGLVIKWFNSTINKENDKLGFWFDSNNFKINYSNNIYHGVINADKNKLEAQASEGKENKWRYNEIISQMPLKLMHDEFDDPEEKAYWNNMATQLGNEWDEIINNMKDSSMNPMAYIRAFYRTFVLMTEYEVKENTLPNEMFLEENYNLSVNIRNNTDIESVIYDRKALNDAYKVFPKKERVATSVWLVDSKMDYNGKISYVELKNSRALKLAEITTDNIDRFVAPGQEKRFNATFRIPKWAFGRELGYFGGQKAKDGEEFLIVFLTGVKKTENDTKIPDIYEGELDIENNIKCTKVRVKVNTGAEMAILFDTTGSMSKSIANAKDNARAILSSLFSKVPSARAALCEFRDHTDSSFSYRVVQPLTNNHSALVSAINSLTVGGGGDGPEAAYSSMLKCMKGEEIGEWSKDAVKSIVLITDAPSHDPDDGVTYDDVVNYAKNSFNLLRGGEGGTDSFSIYVISTPDMQDYSRLASDTGGVFFSMNEGNITSALMDIITRETDRVQYTQLIDLKAGWNWLGFYVLPDNHEINNIFDGIAFTGNDFLQTEVNFSRFDGTQWIPGNITVNYGKMYQLHVDKDVSVTVKGRYSGLYSLPMKAGWNWIANPTSYPVGISELTHSGGFSEGDFMLSFSDTVTYSDGGWLAESEYQLEPGNGYQLFTANAGELVFPERRKGDLYMVVDISEGPNATTYPVRYSPDPPDLMDDTCRTTEIWLRKIPAGTFMMGSPSDELGHSSNETRHQATLTLDYYMGVFEFTQKQYELVMGNNPSMHKGDCRPVEQVSYNTLRGAHGINYPKDRQSVEHTSIMGKLRTKTGLWFDLPSEAQWEYACRAETTTALGSGNNLTSVNEDAYMGELGRYGYNNDDGRGGYFEHTKVGSYRPNGWGLYDMHGNVWEWTLDWYYDYGTNEVTNPAGSRTGEHRVLRGGCFGRNFGGTAEQCRSAKRGYASPNSAEQTYGFRIACSADMTAFMVVDLSGGPTAESYPVRYSAIPPFWINGDNSSRSTELWLRHIHAGTFMMGSPSNELGREVGGNETQHRVTLTKDYYIGVYECTQKHWELVMGSNPSRFKNDPHLPSGIYYYRPVDACSYYDIRGSSPTAGAGWPTYGHNVNADSFMGRLQAKTGLTFDLPTEAQWEYACRAGTTTSLNSGVNITQTSADDVNLSELGRNAFNHNRLDGYGLENHAVAAAFFPNAWGLYDMHGNVFEWVLDRYAPFYPDSAIDPKGSDAPEGVSDSISKRVIRSGDWSVAPPLCRSAYRYSELPTAAGAGSYGFRVACHPAE